MAVSPDDEGAGPLTPERWKRVNDLFQQALGLAPTARPDFLARACGADDALRGEVESLLLAHDHAGGFLGGSGEGGESRPIAAGERLGPYEVVSLLGSGGMGEVYRARDPRLGREVAVKVVARRALTGAGAALRLEREARAAAALNHPSIVAVYDVGLAGDVPFVVSELLEGETVREALERGPMPWRTALELAAQVAAGLAAAHEKGIVHRDLKPENLFLTRDRRLKILDFGLARRAWAPAASPGASALTEPGAILGTVGYMSPEQARGLPADPRSDVFSFGAVLYEMLAGVRAFTGASAVETLSAILVEEPRPLAGVPAQLERVVRRCLRKDAAERFPSGRELASALESVRSGSATAEVGTAERRTEAAAGRRPARASAEAATLHRIGRGHLKRGTHPDLIAALDWFEKARDADPSYAPAWAGLSVAYSRFGFQAQPEGEWHARAQAMCDRALALDPELPEGLFARASLRWSPNGGFDHAGAIADLVAALARRPDLDEAHVRLASILWHVGLLDEATHAVQDALRLNPDNPVILHHVGMCHYHVGRYREALAIEEEIARRAPDQRTHFNIGLCHLRLGRLEEAVRAAEVVTRQDTDEVLAHPILGLVAALRGETAEAHERIRLTSEGKRSFGHYHHAQYEAACVLAQLGEPEPALEWLDAAARNGYPCVPLFESDAFLEPLRGHERYRRLIEVLREERVGYARLLAAGRAER